MQSLKKYINIEAIEHDKRKFVGLSRQLEMVSWKALKKYRKLLQYRKNSYCPLGKQNTKLSEYTAQNISVFAMAFTASFDGFIY